MERYVTDSLDDYPIGICPSCGSSIAHADLERQEDWPSWAGGDIDVPLLWKAKGRLICAVCECSRAVTANVETGSVRAVFLSMSQEEL